MDGTLFPLASRPRTEDAPDYSGRKHAYSLSALIVCDDRRRIRYMKQGGRVLHTTIVFLRTRKSTRTRPLFLCMGVPVRRFCLREYLVLCVLFQETKRRYVAAGPGDF